MSTCSICCEAYNKSTRKEVQCMYCQYGSCRACCQTYILGESSPKCMNGTCGREWTRKFLSESFPMSFITGPLKKHREDVIFDRERALLPATQPYAEAIYKKRILATELRDIDQKIRDLKIKKHQILGQYYRLERNPQDLAEGVEEAEGAGDERTRKHFVKPCPVDDCRGFLSSQHKCGMCETWCCADCHAIIGKSKTAAHTCDPNDVESVKALKAETKPCPKCAVPIFKIDGCDQIWCTQCHIAFSFRTGAIEQKIHNPHYYEWLRQTNGDVPRDPLDRMPCDAQFNARAVAREFRTIFDGITDGYFTTAATCSELRQFSDKITDIARQITHIQQVEIRPQDYEQKNRDLRVRYLTKELNDEKFKTLLQQAEKKHSKHTEVQDVYRLVATASSDIVMRYLRFLQANPYSSDRSIMDEIDGLVGYANGCLHDIQQTYGGIIRVFNQSLILKELK